MRATIKRQTRTTAATEAPTMIARLVPPLELVAISAGAPVVFVMLPVVEVMVEEIVDEVVEEVEEEVEVLEEVEDDVELVVELVVLVLVEVLVVEEVVLEVVELVEEVVDVVVVVVIGIQELVPLQTPHASNLKRLVFILCRFFTWRLS